MPDPKPLDAKTMDVNKLGFGYSQTKCYIIYHYAQGKWDEGKIVENPFIPMHISAECLHYAQLIFEGMKCFRGFDGKVRLFRPQENSKRMNDSAERLCMPTFPEEKFIESCKELVKLNIEYLPSAESNGAMYIRPVMIGSSIQLGVAPAAEYDLIFFCSPVGKYYKDGLSGVNSAIVTDYDRASERGTGSSKIAGNYAISLKPHIEYKKMGFPVELYLDAKTNSKIEEFSTSNFAGILKNADGSIEYHTPQSHSVLPSITNKSLREIAEKMFGWKVVREDIYVNDLSKFQEVIATGTAVVCTPVKSIKYGDKVFKYTEQVGDCTKQLYDAVQGIQYGKIEDKFGWNVFVE